jgi:hypothetical protein
MICIQNQRQEKNNYTCLVSIISVSSRNLLTVSENTVEIPFIEHSTMYIHRSRQNLQSLLSYSTHFQSYKSYAIMSYLGNLSLQS